MRKLLVSSLLVLTCVTAWGQMSDDKIIEYVQEQQAKGVSQEQIIYNLNRRGVTVQQLQRMREKYEKQQSTGVLGNTIPTQGPSSRSRIQSGGMNQVRNADEYAGDRNVVRDNRTIHNERLQNMYDEAMFMFADSLYMLKMSLLPHKEIYGHDIFKNRDLSF